jgi:hypothetical protein
MNYNKNVQPGGSGYQNNPKAHGLAQPFIQYIHPITTPKPFKTSNTRSKGQNRVTLRACGLPGTIGMWIIFSPLPNGVSLEDKSIQFKTVAIVSDYHLTSQRVRDIFNGFDMRVASNVSNFEAKLQGINFIKNTKHNSLETAVVLHSVSSNSYVYVRTVAAMWEGNHFNFTPADRRLNFTRGSSNTVYTLSGGEMVIVSTSCMRVKGGIIRDGL